MGRALNDHELIKVKVGGEDREARAALIAEIAQASSFINEMEGGMEGIISQGGTNVSGGQKQRLAIARALIKQPPSISLMMRCLHWTSRPMQPCGAP